MALRLLQINPLEGFFFGSGKSMVVAGVAVIILIGFALWMFQLESRMRALDTKLDQSLSKQSDSDPS